MLIACAFYSGCTKDTNNPVSSSSDTFFAQIENAWRDSKNSGHTFSFTTDDVNVSFGVFSGIENITDTFDEFELYGAFNNRDVEFIVKRLDGDVKYKGMFTSDTTMEIQSDKDSLTLIKGIL